MVEDAFLAMQLAAQGVPEGLWAAVERKLRCEVLEPGAQAIVTIYNYLLAVITYIIHIYCKIK